MKRNKVMKLNENCDRRELYVNAADMDKITVLQLYSINAF